MAAIAAQEYLHRKLPEIALKQVSVPATLQESPTVVVIDVPMILHGLWRLFNGAHMIGPDLVAEFILTGASWQAGGNIDMENFNLIYASVRAIANLTGNGKRLENETDRLLAFSYSLIRDKQINRQEAADFVSFITEKEIEREAWRKRVDRWAEDNGLPPAGKPRQRKDIRT